LPIYAAFFGGLQHLRLGGTVVRRGMGAAVKGRVLLGCGWAMRPKTNRPKTRNTKTSKPETGRTKRQRQISQANRLMILSWAGAVQDWGAR